MWSCRVDYAIRSKAHETHETVNTGHAARPPTRQRSTRTKTVREENDMRPSWTLEDDGAPTKKVHVYGRDWSLEASDYEPVW